MGYSKLDSDITESSVWAEDHETLRVWVYLLAKKDYFGEVHVTPPALAMHCGVPLPRVEQILRKFESPDPHSRSRENEGRRISIDRQDDYTIKVLNSDKYRHKDYSHAERQRRYQKKKDQLLTVSDAGAVTPPSLLSDSDGQSTYRQINTKDSCPTPLDESKTAPRKKRKTIAYSKEFLVFWEEYPRPVAKPTAWEAYRRATETATAGAILDGLYLALPELKSRALEYRPHPATWLNQRRWEDVIDRPSGNPGPFGDLPQVPL